MSLRDHLIRVLADGEVHSGSALAGKLGVSRSAIWKQIHRLADLGLDVQASGGRGYRLAGALELLDRELIARHLDEETRATCEQLEVMSVTASTNASLTGQAGRLWACGAAPSPNIRPVAAAPRTPLGVPLRHRALRVGQLALRQRSPGSAGPVAGSRNRCDARPGHRRCRWAQAEVAE